MKNIHLSPTLNKSCLYYDKGILCYNTIFIKIPLLRENQYIYITSDEEIKGTQDWYLWGNKIYKNRKGDTPKSFCEKIIMTNDLELIDDGVQKVDNVFLKWFVNNATREFIEVKKEKIFGRNSPLDLLGFYTTSYKIIIPEEEKPVYSCPCGNQLINTSTPDPLCSLCGHIFIRHINSNDCTSMIYNPKGEEELKCTCERPDDFTCDYCDMLESKQILEKAKKRAEQMETIEEYSKKHSTTEEDMIYEASMKYLWRVADCKRTTGYADEDFREGYKAGMNLAQGYLNANLENFEKMKDLFDIKDVERIANHFYYKGIKKSSIPEVKFDFDEFIKTFKKQ